jgi:hypothetical protein
LLIYDSHQLGAISQLREHAWHEGGWEFEEEEATNIKLGYKMKSNRASFDFTYLTT